MTGSPGRETAADSLDDVLDAQDRVGYDPVTHTHHAHHSWETPDPLCLTVIEAFAEVTGREPTELNPLYSVLDPDAFETPLVSARETDVQVEFTFEGCAVSVASSGEIVIDLND